MKSKPVVRPLVVDKEKLEKLKEILKKGLSRDQRYNAIRKYCGAICCDCEDIPTKMLVYDVEGAEVIENYCDKCAEKWVKIRNSE